MKKLLLLIALISLSDKLQGQSSPWQPANGSNFMQYCNWCSKGTALFTFCKLMNFENNTCWSAGGVFYDAVSLCGSSPIMIDPTSPVLSLSCTNANGEAGNAGYGDIDDSMCPKACNGNCYYSWRITPPNCPTFSNEPKSNELPNNKEVKK